MPSFAKEVYFLLAVALLCSAPLLPAEVGDTLNLTAGFVADVTPYILDPAVNGIYATDRSASLSLPPNELHPLNYNGDTAISKISEKPVMKPAGEKGTFPVLRTHPRGYKDNGNIPIGT